MIDSDYEGTAAEGVDLFRRQLAAAERLVAYATERRDFLREALAMLERHAAEEARHEADAAE